MDNVDDSNKRRRRRRSVAPAGTTIKPADLQGDNVDKLEFQVVAESEDGVRSDIIKPKFFMIGKFLMFFFLFWLLCPYQTNFLSFTGRFTYRTAQSCAKFLVRKITAS